MPDHLRIAGLVCERRGVRVLNGVSFTCGIGQAVGVVGPNGSGKSTLLKVIAGVLPPISGQIFLDGESLIGSADFERVARGVVFVPQERGCFMRMTIYDQLLLAACSRHVWPDPARSVQELSERYGTDTFLKRYGFELSGGQRQLVSIVRAALQKPKLLLLDEPTTGLDTNAITEVVEATRTLISSLSGAALIVEHRMSLFGDLVQQRVTLGPSVAAAGHSGLHA